MSFCSKLCSCVQREAVCLRVRWQLYRTLLYSSHIVYTSLPGLACLSIIILQCQCHHNDHTTHLPGQTILPRLHAPECMHYCARQTHHQPSRPHPYPHRSPHPCVAYTANPGSSSSSVDAVCLVQALFTRLAALFGQPWVAAPEAQPSAHLHQPHSSPQRESR